MLTHNKAVYSKFCFLTRNRLVFLELRRTASSNSATKELVLGDEQKKLVDLIVNKGNSVFFTGAAGTGKSVVLREVIKQLKQKYPDPQSVAITASTGLAGLNIGGRTYQSYLGIGLGLEPVSDLVQRIRRKNRKENAWKNCKVLVIDEVSMIDAKMITKLSHIGKYFKKNMKPFGGIQLVFVGDFYQLPPVVDKNIIEFIQSDDLAMLGDADSTNESTYAFESDEWKKAMDHEISLTKIYRQESDPTFIKMLNEVRVGEVSNETDMEFRKLCMNNLQESRDIEQGEVHTRLDFLEGSNIYPTKYETNKYNRKRLNAIDATPVTYDCYKSGTLKGTREFEMINESIIVPDELTLKKGAQVMLVKNQSSSLVNGSLGSVVDFVSLPNYENFEKKGKGNSIFDFLLDNKADVKGNPNLERKLELREIQLNDTETRCLPLVKFCNINTNVIQYKVISPEFFEFKDPDTEDILFSKKQIPLIMAWALSVHKSQGQTYEKLNCDLSRIFEDGQAYVALSRVTSRAGLKLKSWNRAKVQVNPIVKKYYSDRIKAVHELDSKTKSKRPLFVNQTAIEDEIDFVDSDDFSKKRNFRMEMDDLSSYEAQDSSQNNNFDNSTEY